MTLPDTIGKYRIDQLIKRGGMGAVYLGFDPELKRKAAIKLLRDDIEGDDLLERFKREAVAIAAVRHPNIVTIYHADVDDGRPYIAMEYIPGQTLAELIRRPETLPLPRKLQIVEDVCRALSAAHRAGIVHRDVKPANVMVDDDGHVTLLDFGIARTSEGTLTQVGALVGTLNYMAPEQMNDGLVDARSDIFALGALLYELIAGKPAFPRGVSVGVARGEAPSLLGESREVGRDLAAIVAKALRMDPQQRYQDVDSLRLDLARTRTEIEDGVTVIAKRREAPPEPLETARSQPAEWPAPSTAMPSHGRWLAAVTAGAVVVFLAALWLVPGPGSEPALAPEPAPPETVVQTPVPAPVQTSPEPVVAPPAPEVPAFVPPAPADRPVSSFVMRVVRLREDAVAIAERYFDALSREDLTAVAEVRRLNSTQRAELQASFRKSSGPARFSVDREPRADAEKGVATVFGTVVTGDRSEAVVLRLETVKDRLMIVRDDRKPSP